MIINYNIMKSVYLPLFDQNMKQLTLKLYDIPNVHIKWKKQINYMLF